MKALDRVTGRLRELRARTPWLDHAVRAHARHVEVRGDQLAAAVTYFGFLSFFPLVALSFALLGYVTSGYPEVQDDVTRAVEDAFPGVVGEGSGQISIEDVISARRGAGIIGLLGLLYAGLGWLDALRSGLRRVFGVEGVDLDLVRRKLRDVLLMLVLGVSLLVSVVVSSLATSATTAALDVAGLAESLVATGVLKVVSVGLALLGSVVIFAILLSRLSGAHLRWHQVRSGAVLGAVGFEVLKLAGTFLVARTAANPLYTTFGVLFGLLVWINLVSRLTVLVGAWTATRPPRADVVSAGAAGAPGPAAGPRPPAG